MENKIYKLVIDKNDVDEFNGIYQNAHPRSKKLPIKAPQHPSINTYTRMHHQSANKLKQDWCNFIVWVLKKNNLNNCGIQKCRITYKTFFNSIRRRDLDNISPKYIFDGFVAANFVEDDSSEHIMSLTIECAVDKKNPRIEFYIEVIE